MHMKRPRCKLWRLVLVPIAMATNRHRAFKCLIVESSSLLGLNLGPLITLIDAWWTPQGSSDTSMHPRSRPTTSSRGVVAALSIVIEL